MQYRAQAGISAAESADTMPILPEIVALPSPESAARIVNPKLPARVGVPETRPSAPSVRPPGRAPAVTVHVYGATPPETDSATGT